MDVEGRGQPTTKFMILMPWGRVGSNLLFSNIRQVLRNRKARFANENFISLKQNEEQIEWMRQFYGGFDGFDVAGSKQNILSVRQTDALGDVLTKLDVRLIKMRRVNIVKVAISQLRAEIYAERSATQTGVPAWGVRYDQSPLESAPLKPQRFLNVATRARKADSLLSCFSPPVATFDIEYDDLQSNPEHVTTRVCEWLGVATEDKIQTAYIKGTPDNLALAVPNLDELRFALRASPLADLESMFDD